MSILKKKFDPLKATRSHEGTILASGVVPDGYEVPFEHAYGYLLNNQTMAGHAHETDEIYIVLEGTGYVTVGGRNRRVSAGDVVAIPPNVWHTMMCTDTDSAPFLWAALWWPHLESNTPFGEEIVVKRFDIHTAYRAHQDTILADLVVPEQLKAPFFHQYGYLTNGKTMELHKHPADEIYIIYSGCGTVIVGNEKAHVEPGDVIVITPDEMHTLTAESDTLIWAALWWNR